MKRKILLGLLVLVTMFAVTGCVKFTFTIGDGNAMANTEWLAGDDSQVVFTKDRIDWYQSADEHDDNYYSGTYKYYRGDKAIDYITTELSEYGVTKDELDGLFSRSNYKKDDFVVFDIRYDKFIINGQNKDIARPLVPWYGFISENDSHLYVANMNTGSTYNFDKQK